MYPTERPVTGELVPLDSGRIRRKFLGACRRARTTFEKAETELQTFEREEQPAFEQWRRRELGRELHEVEDLRRRRAELEQKLGMLDRIRHAYGCSAAEALEIYEREMATPEEPETEEEQQAFEERLREQAEAQRRAEEEREKVWEALEQAFLDFLLEYRGVIRRAVEAKVPLRDLQREVLATFASEEGLPGEALVLLMERERVREAMRAVGLLSKEEEGATESSVENANRDVRIKQLAREMAFALHPDQCGEHDEQKLELWHRVQAAVKAKDLDELEVLHAHMQLMLGDVSPNVSVSRLQDLTEMYRRSRGALRRQIRQFRSSPSWAFLSFGERERSRLRRRLELELREERRELVLDLRDLEREEKNYSRSGPEADMMDLFGL